VINAHICIDFCRADLPRELPQRGVARELIAVRIQMLDDGVQLPVVRRSAVTLNGFDGFGFIPVVANADLRLKVSNDRLIRTRPRRVVGAAETRFGGRCFLRSLHRWRSQAVTLAAATGEKRDKNPDTCTDHTRQLQAQPMTASHLAPACFRPESRVAATARPR